MRTAYLLLLVRMKREYVTVAQRANPIDALELSAGIYSEPAITMSFDVAQSVVMEVQAPSYSEARESILRQLRERAVAHGGVWQWMLEQASSR